MNRSDAFARYRNNTIKVSEITRQLSLVGVALVWLFRETGPDEVRLHAALKFSAAVFIAALALDLFQYLIGAAKWHKFAQEKEAELNLEAASRPEKEQVAFIQNQQFDAPSDINKWTEMAYLWKIVLLVIGYLPLLWFLFTHT